MLEGLGSEDPFQALAARPKLEMFDLGLRLQGSSLNCQLEAWAPRPKLGILSSRLWLQLELKTLDFTFGLRGPGLNGELEALAPRHKLEMVS